MGLKERQHQMGKCCLSKPISAMERNHRHLGQVKCNAPPGGRTLAKKMKLYLQIEYNKIEWTVFLRIQKKTQILKYIPL